MKLYTLCPEKWRFLGGTYSFLYPYAQVCAEM